VSLYVADRKTGAPVEKADVALWANGKQQSQGQTGATGWLQLAMINAGANAAGGAGTGECVDTGAAWQRCGADDAVEL
jgi:hypothetical protein